MADRYSGTMQQTSVFTVDGETATDGTGELVAAATVRPKIYDLLFSHGSAPADTVLRWELTRRTAAGSVAEDAIGENPLDPGSPASLCTAFEELTVGPTITAASQLLDFDLNQRATFRWVAAPGSELIVAATAAAGVVVNAASASYTGISRCTLLWEE